MGFDFLTEAISFSSFFGIFSILAVSLNLEYGFAGQPNFGKVLFYGLGAFVAGVLSATLIRLFANQPAGDICSSGLLIAREKVALTDPIISLSTWLIGIVAAVGVAGVAGFLASYPALRVKEEWYLSMILLVAAEMFRVILANTPQFGCGFDGLAGITNPFQWVDTQLSNTYPKLGATQIPVYISSGLYSIVILAFALGCYLVAQRLVNSPYGRVLKSIRDDKIASESLGKNVNKIRSQILIIGSAMSGLAGALYVFYVGVAISDDYISAVTFSIFVMLVLGGLANNKGALVGALVLTALDRSTLLLGILLQGVYPGFNANLLNYLRYLVEAVILLALLMFRPRGIFPERRINTRAYEVFDFEQSNSASKK